MKTFFKCTMCIALSLMCLLTCVGYANLSSNMTVIGTLEADPPECVYITNIKDVTDPTGSNIDKNSFSFHPGSTTVESTISRGTKYASGVVKYEVTVYNNTDVTYYFRDIDYQTGLEGYNGNEYISEYSPYTSINIDSSIADNSIEAKKLSPGEHAVVTVTYTIGAGLNSELDWKLLINVRFGINVDAESDAIDAVEERFLRILNTTSTYEQLLDALDNKYDGINAWKSNYIGNVVGSFNDDSVSVNTLFAGQLQITVGGVPRDATVLIKHENVDWIMDTGDNYVAEHPNGGRVEGTACEMTLYLTIDPLTASGQYVPVYAVVFTCDRDEETGERLSDWYKIGSRYAGEADVVTYDGNYGTGSFVTDRWRATTETYDLISGYSFKIKNQTYRLDPFSYEITSGTSLSQILNKQDFQAIETLEHLLDDAKRIIDNKDYAGEGIDRVREAYERYSDLYWVDGNGNHTIHDYWPVYTLGKVTPAITELYGVVNAALSGMASGQ